MSGEDNILKLVDAEPDDEGYRLQEQVGFILRKAHQRHVAIFASRIGDLTPPQFAALARLREAGDTSQNQLGALVAMDAATIKGVIDRLKARGLVGVRGAGVAYDGLYYVSSVTSRLKRGEFKQSFELTRNGLVSITPNVPV